MEFSIGLIFLVIIIVFGHILIQNQRTYLQRMKIIDRIGEVNTNRILEGEYCTLPSLWDSWNKTSYNDHILTLIIFKDYKKIYSKDIQDIMD